MSTEAMKLAIAKEALEKLAKLGNGDRYGNSIGNSIAMEALDKMAENARELGLSYEQPAQQEPVAWRELCRRLYVELFHCDRQMMATLDEDGEPVWTQGKTVRDVLADAKAALETSPLAPTQEPDPDELTIAYMSGLYEGKKRKPWVGLTDEECVEAIDEGFAFGLDNGNVSDKVVICYARTIEAKLKEKNS